MEALIPIVMFGLVAWIIKFSSDNKLKRYMLDKGVTAETMQMMFSQPVRDNTPASLKWGLVLTAVGLGAFIGLNFADGQDEYVLASMLLCGGLALVVYYIIASRFTGNK